MERYAALAEEQASSTVERERQDELLQIAASCRWLAEHPARDFREALQAVWVLFALLQIESNASSFSPGRFDQYMLPYLEQDLAAGKLTLVQPRRCSNSSGSSSTRSCSSSSHSARYFAGFPIGFNIALGGQLADGSDATDLLSYMCLRARPTWA